MRLFGVPVCFAIVAMSFIVTGGAVVATAFRASLTKCGVEGFLFCCQDSV